MEYLVFGAGVSGLGACELLAKQNNKVYLYDKDKKKLHDLKRAKLVADSVVLCTKSFKNCVHSTMCIVLSPGVLLTPKIDKIIKKYNLTTLGELELGAKNCQGTLIVITGTNGKTTTTTLTDFVLNYAQKHSFCVGNVGISICSVALKTKPQNYIVCEASSFQLEHSKTMHPHIVAFLNFAPDHLDRYKTLDDYLSAKSHVFDNLDNNDYVVLNYDDDVVRACAHKTNARVIYFSVNHILDSFEYSAWVFEQVLHVKLGDKIHRISTIGTKLSGMHNVANMLVASVIALLCGVDENLISEAFVKYTLPSHRCEFVGEFGGVRYIDDSKATNIHATTNALANIKTPIVLMLGGSDKGEDFDVFFAHIPNNVKAIVTFGQMGKKLYKLANKYNVNNVHYVRDFKLALDEAKSQSLAGDTVLLSPACASFDAFDSYAERGDYFKYLVCGGDVE